MASLEGILSSTSRTGGIHVLNFPPQDQGETLREAMIRSLITLYKQHIAVFQLRFDMSTVYISDNFTLHSSVAHSCVLNLWCVAACHHQDFQLEGKEREEDGKEEEERKREKEWVGQ